MKAKRLRWNVFYDAKNDMLIVELEKAKGPFFALEWRDVGDEHLFDASKKLTAENATRYIRIMKRQILMEFINNTSTKALLDQVIAAANGPVTAEELKDAADALTKRAKEEKAG